MGTSTAAGFVTPDGNITSSVVGYTSTFGLWWRALAS